MSSSESFAQRDVVFSKTCNCKPVHKCLKNFNSQFPEATIRCNYLRHLDLIPIPRPTFVSEKSVCDFTQQVEESDILQHTTSLILRDEQLSAQGSSLFDTTESDLKSVIESHIKSPKKVTHVKPTAKGWPK